MAMQTISSILLALFVLASPSSWLASAKAHGWYPKECCHDMDCAVVDSVAQFVPAGGGLPQLVVTSKHGRAIVPHGFPVRDSMDGRMQVCMRPDPDGVMDVICLFLPPQM
jgi:hypothetical protein